MRFFNIFLIAIIMILLVRLSGPASALTSDDVRIIQWAGRSWRVRSWPGGPGPNDWCDTPDCVWVDGEGNLHLTIQRIDGRWCASEVNTSDFTNFGEHRFYVQGPIDVLDPNVVLGLFLYSNIEDDDIEELDVEFALWGDADPAADEGWYTTWRQNDIGEQYHFNVALNDLDSTHAIDWQTDQIAFESLQGFHQQVTDPGDIIAQWQTNAPDVIPAPEDEMRIHINLWLLNGLPPTDGQNVEIVIHDLDAPPEPPKNIWASDGVSADAVHVEWDATPTADSYRIFRAAEAAGAKTLVGTSTTTAFDDAGAQPDVTYTYWVAGVNDQGESLLSAGDQGRRAIPMAVNVHLLDGADVELQWVHQDAACEYHVHRALSPYFAPSSTTISASLTAPSSSYTFFDDAGQPEQNHYYLVQAVGCESGAFSDSNRTGEFDFLLAPGA